MRIRAFASAVNHTDLEIRAGRWPVRRSPAFPYVPGVEVLGEVVEAGAGVVDLREGARVVTMMQGLGGVRAERPGGYAQFVTVPADAAALVPGEVDALAMAAVGLPGVTAFEAFGPMRPLAGKTVLVTGAAGGVGSAATALARAEGAAVVALVSRPEQADYVRRLGAERVVVAAKDGRPELEPESLDGVLDAVGGRVFGAAVAALRPGPSCPSSGRWPGARSPSTPGS